jgi:hypothetical protein
MGFSGEVALKFSNFGGKLRNACEAVWSRVISVPQSSGVDFALEIKDL